MLCLMSITWIISEISALSNVPKLSRGSGGIHCSVSSLEDLKQHTLPEDPGNLKRWCRGLSQTNSSA